MRYKTLFPFCLMLWPYLILPLFLLQTAGVLQAIPQAGSWYFIGYVLLTPIVYLSNIVFACLNRHGSPRYLARWNMMIKLAHIPFYLAVFAIGLGFLLAAVGLFLADLLLLITSSMYGIQAVIRAKKRSQLTTGKAAAHIIAHLFFVADVISAVLLYRELTMESARNPKTLPS